MLRRNAGSTIYWHCTIYWHNFQGPRCGTLSLISRELAHQQNCFATWGLFGLTEIPHIKLWIISEVVASSEQARDAFP